MQEERQKLKKKLSYPTEDFDIETLVFSLMQ